MDRLNTGGILNRLPVDITWQRPEEDGMGSTYRIVFGRKTACGAAQPTNQTG
jgi:hypothetical protein